MISFIIFLSLMGAAQWYMNISELKIEQYEYEIIKSFDDFEIRKYKPAIFSSIQLNASSYSETSSKGFRQLAGYIFGDNEREQKIAMTSPVAMEIDSHTKMMFMVPSAYKLEDLPKPNNQNIRFEQHDSKYMAAIRFGGWANDERIAKYERKLAEALQREGIKAKGKFLYFGYNPPYELVNRRNEVVIEIEFSAESDDI
ncbi:MAG: SOUL family heme-binding protein [Flavobacteriales bacterium]